MSSNLSHGSNVIRVSLFAGLATALAALIYNVIRPGHSAVATIALGIDIITFSLVLWLLTRRRLVKRVSQLSSAMNLGAEGDLTVKVDASSTDELGTLSRNFNDMIERLAGMAARVSASVGELRQIANNIREVSNRGVTSAQRQSEGVRDTLVAVQEINDSVNEVAAAVDGLARTAGENSASVLEMSASIDEVITHVETLAAAVEEVSASIIEMAEAEKEIARNIDCLMQDAADAASRAADLDSSIKQVGRNALVASDITLAVRADAEAGKETVLETISGIGEIRRSSRITFESIESLSGRVSNIGKILQVIDEVAEQTNLLALNASIIAAQAGEHGKGFAVVADEIKELAKRTSSSTREITGIIKGVQEETQRAVEAINLSERRIADGEKLSQRSGDALNKIVAGVAEATTKVTEIAGATVDQTKGSQDIKMTMERVAEMVKQIARSTREQERGNEMIMSASERMKDLTSQVRRSTIEQRAASSTIVQSTEHISTMIGHIGMACELQLGNSDRIVRAVQEFRHSTEAAEEVTGVINDAVRGLAKQIDLLHNEMSSFRLEQAKGEQNPSSAYKPPRSDA